MHDSIAKLRALVASDRFLSKVDGEPLDDLLDARDCDPFDGQWVRADRELKPLRQTEAPEVRALRELAYKRAYALTHSPDACGYISDDFGLLADALTANWSDPWLTGLFEAYCAGKLPCGELTLSDTKLQEAVANWTAPPPTA